MCSLSPRQVSREIDAIIPCVAEHLPLDATINILKPIISTGAFPTNLCALKILKELTEWQGQQISEKQLDSIMEQITKVGRIGGAIESVHERRIPIALVVSANGRHRIDGAQSGRLLYRHAVRGAGRGARATEIQNAELEQSQVWMRWDLANNCICFSLKSVFTY